MSSSLSEEEVYPLVHLPHLKSLAFRPPRLTVSFSKPAEDWVVEIVKRFKDCVRLVQLIIHCDNLKYRSALIADRLKDFDMFGGGVQYRTW